MPDTNDGPKNSISDSKLAVDYFQTQNDATSLNSSSKSDTYSPQMITKIGDKPTGVSSESHHSLSTRLGSEERLRQEVQRTVSMSSENQSEAFFSADEELNPSRTSSLRHSMIGSGTVLCPNSAEAPPGGSPIEAYANRRRKFASDLSIVADRNTRDVCERKAGGSGKNPAKLG